MPSYVPFNAIELYIFMRRHVVESGVLFYWDVYLHSFATFQVVCLAPRHFLFSTPTLRYKARTGRKFEGPYLMNMRVSRSRQSGRCYRVEALFVSVWCSPGVKLVLADCTPPRL